MRRIGSFEAKNKLGTLLDWVEGGEEVIITRRGRDVARLVSAAAGPDTFEDEQTPASLAMLERLVEEGAAAPTLWPLEILNALAVAERRRRLDRHRRLELAGLLRDLPIKVDVEGLSRAWTHTAELAERFALTIYDAAYLELALRLELPIATLDRALAGAAQAEGVPLI